MLTALIPALGYSAQASITGEGRVLSAPDYVELSINVQSSCYATPDAAREANDKAASEIVRYLNSKIKDNGFYNKVISEGGYTQTYQTYYRDKILCENTFQKNNNIRIRTQNVEQFSRLFDSIQKEVYKQFQTEPRSMIESSVTFVTLSAPTPRISSERQNKLEKEAMGKALVDAKSKLQGLFDGQVLNNLKIVDVSEYREETPRPIPMAQGARMMMSAGATEKVAAPVQFDDQWVVKTMYFRFAFDDVTITP